MKNVIVKTISCLILPGLIIISFACKKETPSSPENKSPSCPYKDQICDSSKVTILNRTLDTLFYGVGTSWYEDTVLSGQHIFLTFGKVNVTYDAQCVQNKHSWSIPTLHTNWGEWAFNMDHCDKRIAFDYTDTSRGRIQLYDVTEY